MSQVLSTLLCRYLYDPLDRLASRSSAGQASEQSFYLASLLATQVQGQARRSWLQGAGQWLAQQRNEAGATHCTLIATDAQGSVLHGQANGGRQAYAYTVYGNRHPAMDPLHLPGFNCEIPDPVTGHYLLGNGYRAFNPVLLRFNSPDNLSPFGKGGVNACAYCAGDPVNQVDPGGHFPNPVKALKNLFGYRIPKRKRVTTMPDLAASRPRSSSESLDRASLYSEAEHAEPAPITRSLYHPDSRYTGPDTNGIVRFREERNLQGVSILDSFPGTSLGTKGMSEYLEKIDKIIVGVPSLKSLSMEKAQMSGLTISRNRLPPKLWDDLHIAQYPSQAMAMRNVTLRQRPEERLGALTLFEYLYSSDPGLTKLAGDFRKYLGTLPGPWM